MVTFIHSPISDFPMTFMGPSLEKGPLPAFFYFALCAEESLTLSPYNGPIPYLDTHQLRVFSFTLPAHGPGFDKHHAMEQWISSLQKRENILDPFFEKAESAIRWLFDQHYLEETKIAFGGLSRGGFIATHLASRFSLCRYLLNFASLTTLSTLLTSREIAADDVFRHFLSRWDLHHLAPSLTHLRSSRFYHSLRDQMVGTEECYRFITQLEEIVQTQRIRHCHLELFLTSPIGHKGHGTSPEIFREGARWLNTHLLGD